MTQSTKELIRAVTIGIMVGVLGILGIMNIQQYQAKQIQKEQSAQTQLDLRFYTLQKQIKDLITEIKITNYDLDGTYKKIDELNKKILTLPQAIQAKKEFIEYSLRQASVVIYNDTMDGQGSGVTIKYKGKFYILTAGHMLDKKDDKLSFSENGQKIDDLEVVKWDYTWTEETQDTNVSQVHDLLLLKPKNPYLRPRFYVELEETEPQPPTEIYVVGTPVGIEDVLCEGRIIKYKDNFVYYIGTTYYGNSGGGIFTKEGKLIGIVSHMYPIYANPNIPPYMVYGATRLYLIQSFLGDIE